MTITQGMLRDAHREVKGIRGAKPEHYFGLVYLEQVHGLPRERALAQVSLGSNDAGIDGYHVDAARRALYLFQCHWTASTTDFEESIPALVNRGLPEIFAPYGESGSVDELQRLLTRNRVPPVISALRTDLYHNRDLINKVVVQLVFKGDVQEADKRETIRSLRDDLHARQHLLQGFFERPVELVSEFRSARDQASGALLVTKKVHEYEIDVADTLSCTGPNGTRMFVTFISLQDLHRMYQEMRSRFFSDNVRAALGKGTGPNRALAKTLKEITTSTSADPTTFVFNHNGVTLHVAKLELLTDVWRLTEPRLLNGAQTVSTVHRILEQGEKSGSRRNGALRQTKVLCKIITDADPPFVNAVTVSNNRQNPVKPWNLRANDLIQKKFQDWFATNLGIYYERQEGAFDALLAEELEQRGIVEDKPIKLVKLAQTYLAVDGRVDKMTHMREAFESDTIYNSLFNERRLSSNPWHVVLCYKVQYRIRRLLQEILERGESKYAYIFKARSVVWALTTQAILNDDQLPERGEQFGADLIATSPFTEWLADLVSRRVRFIIADVVAQEPYDGMLTDQQYGFLTTHRFYELCRQAGEQRYGWTRRGLP